MYDLWDTCINSSFGGSKDGGGRRKVGKQAYLLFWGET